MGADDGLAGHRLASVAYSSQRRGERRVAGQDAEWVVAAPKQLRWHGCTGRSAIPVRPVRQTPDAPQRTQLSLATAARVDQLLTLRFGGTQ